MKCTDCENPDEKKNGSAEALAVYEGGYAGSRIQNKSLCVPVRIKRRISIS